MAITIDGSTISGLRTYPSGGGFTDSSIINFGNFVSSEWTYGIFASGGYGYIKLPNNFQLQWTTVSITGGTRTYVTLPYSFTNGIEAIAFNADSFNDDGNNNDRPALRIGYEPGNTGDANYYWPGVPDRGGFYIFNSTVTLSILVVVLGY